jgi:hypothetical protein
MPSSHAPPSPNAPPTKRKRHSSTDLVASPTTPTAPATRGSGGGGMGGGAGGGADAVEQHSPAHSEHNDGAAAGHGGGKVGQGSNFRNVSACNRCRLRKNRCDQKLPSCNSCAKANVACVGYDPITKKQIPRR